MINEAIPKEILVVDDEAFVARLLTAELESAGYRVRTASDGHAAIEAVLDHVPDLVLLDIAMPGIDGIETCRLLRQQESTRETPIVILTGHGDQPEIVEAFAAGATDFLRKPIPKPELLARVASHLQMRQQSIEELRVVSDELTRERVRVDTIIDSVPGIVWEASGEPGVDERIQYVSRHVESMIGFRPHECYETPNFFWNRLVHPEDRERVQAWTRSVLHGTSPAPIEFRFMTKSGDSVWTQTQAIPVLDSSRDVVGICGVTTDISARKVAEAELLSAKRSRLEALESLQQTLISAIGAIAATLEMRDPYTAGHQRRVADLAAAIAAELGFPQSQIDGLRLAATIHDIGKISIPAEILSKPGRLNPIEFELLKTHPQAGYSILQGLNFPWPIAEMVIQHHERLDGSGYPNGLRGDQIRIESKVLAVADVVEAMNSHRPYRPALGLDAALEEIASGRGTRYERSVVDACIAIFNEDRFQEDRFRFE